MDIKILVVDDEPEITESLVRILKMEGYDATGVTNPLVALDMVKKENYLIVVSDIQMPEMRGTELLQKIKEYNGMIQVIIITGFVTIDNILTCLRRGANDCFFKPLKSSEALLAAVAVAKEKLTRWENIIGELVKMKAG